MTYDSGALGTPPGAVAFDAGVRARIGAALEAQIARGETPRTRHRDGVRPHFTNRLVLETSPYLRQHAHNPVNWYPWGDDAFALARESGRPVFLSVGYSTCHWCHVMEEESFEDIAIATLLNERYVAIKVDREERPDVDTVYMTALQALTRQGGWPMSVWLDADRRPFFAATYLPPHDGARGAMRGFDSIAGELARVYREDAARVAESAASIVDVVRASMTGSPAGGDVPGPAVLDAAAAAYARIFDHEHGGLTGAPKFPSSLPVRLLLREHRRTGAPQPLAMATQTLEAMAAGGMHDQLAGGFHRYSTDNRWLVPHFEKMLYDNALLAVCYAEAWQVTRRPDFERVLRTTLDYVLREMTTPEGGFYSATDADSEGEEGTFFVWTADEIRTVLGADAPPFERFYGVTARGNFEGKNVLFVRSPHEETWRSLAGARERLRVVREARPLPLRDDKVLAAWNALTISALAFGGFVLGDGRYTDAARRAMDFVLRDVVRDGRVQRSWKAGQTSGAGYLEDDAFVVAALLDCYEATFQAHYLRDALTFARRTETLFADAEHGGWFRSAEDHERLIAREKPSHDGAEPTGASVAVRNALRLHAITGDDAWRTIAERALRAYATVLEQQPGALAEMLLAVDFARDVVPEIVIVRAHDAPSDPFVDALRGTFLPNRALLGATAGESLADLATLAPLAGEKTADGATTAYVCERGACRLPTTDVATMLDQIATLARS
ncbi:MAG: thioredoxin domain-containing protein [Vulcanimicrobiaceae bacterium]